MLRHGGSKLCQTPIPGESHDIGNRKRYSHTAWEELIKKHIALLRNKRITLDKWKEVNFYRSPIKRLQDSYQEITKLL